MPEISFDNFGVLDTMGANAEKEEESQSWTRRRDGRNNSKADTDIIGGNTREIQACPVFRNRVHDLYEQGKISFDVLRLESLTDVTMDKTNKYKDRGDSLIELYRKEWGTRSGKFEFKIQPKLYAGRSKRLLLKVALKEISVTKCIETNQPIIVVLRWNPLEYEEKLGEPKWLVLSVDNLKTLGIDTHGWADPIPLYEYTHQVTGGRQLGWRLLEKAPIEKYNDQWICWQTFDNAKLVEFMLVKIWNDLGKQNDM